MASRQLAARRSGHVALGWQAGADVEELADATKIGPAERREVVDPHVHRCYVHRCSP